MLHARPREIYRWFAAVPWRSKAKRGAATSILAKHRQRLATFPFSQKPHADVSLIALRPICAIHSSEMQEEQNVVSHQTSRHVSTSTVKKSAPVNTANCA